MNADETILPEPDPMARDTVPRVPHISYIQAVLEGIAKGSTFDALRQCLAVAAADAKRLFDGSPAAPRLLDGFSLWSPVADAVGELMKLGYVEDRTLPSRRKNVDAHRNAKYVLTDSGLSAVSALRANPSAFRGELTGRLLKAHSYFLTLCQCVAAEPLLIAEYTEEDLVNFRTASRSWISALADNAAEHMSSVMKGSHVSAEAVATRIRDSMAKRFPAGAEPTRKEVLDVVHDALIVAALESKGLRIDAVTFDTLIKWASQLFLLNESRYVQNVPGRIVWATAHINNTEQQIAVERKGVGEWGDKVAAEIPKAYDDIAKGISDDYGGPAVRYPYLEIYRVRSLVAYRLGVNNPVVDRVISEVADGTRPTNYRIELALGDRRWGATSEAPFRIGLDRKYVMLVKKGEST